MTVTAPSGSGQGDEPYRVMLVDDSAVVRGLLSRIFEADPDIEIVAKAGNGQDALERLSRNDVEVVVLDIEMPVMDGLTALPKLLEAKPTLKVIMSSTLTRKNAEVSLKALELGAADYLTKPSASSELTSPDGFSQEICRKIKALGAASRGNKTVSAGIAAKTDSDPVKKHITGMPLPEQIQLRKAAIMPPAAIAIGSSTGGPQALVEVISKLAPHVEQPIFITQHMPAMFTALLADNLGRVSGRPCGEAKDGEPVQTGHIYVAPGDHHLLVEEKNGSLVTRLATTPPENFCRPAVDPMLRSLSKVYGGRLLVAILTGMGSDGAKGSETVVSAGGTVIAQDEATSVVWGMPGATAAAGVCSAVIPLTEIAPFIRKCALRSAA